MSDETVDPDPGQEIGGDREENVESGDISDWEKIDILNTVREATLLAGFLRSSGIPATIESRFFTQEPVNIGTLGKVHVFVPRERLAEAERLLEQLEKEPFDELGRELSESDEGSGPAQP